MKFIRVRGRIVPIKDKKEHKPDYKGLGIAAGGAGVSILGANKVGKALAKFGRSPRIAGILGTVFVGEAIASEGIDRFAESLKMSKRKEQNIKNIAGGTIGVLGAVSALGLGKFKMRRLK